MVCTVEVAALKQRQFFNQAACKRRHLFLFLAAMAPFVADVTCSHVCPSGIVALLPFVCCAAVEPPNKKVKRSHAPDGDALRGMMEAAEQASKKVVHQCLPLLEMIQEHCVELGPRMTSMQVLSTKIEGVEAQVPK